MKAAILPIPMSSAYVLIEPQNEPGQFEIVMPSEDSTHLFPPVSKQTLQLSTIQL